MKIGYEPPPGGVYLPEMDPNNHERVYTRVRHNGAVCIMDPKEAEALVACASIDDECEFELSEIRMTPAAFDRLPDFAGY